jgi:hypothetical protein
MDSQGSASQESLPDNVRALLRERIESYEELEALLALERLRGAGLTTVELSAALRVNGPLIEQALRVLETRSLVRSRNAAERPLRYFYAPSNAELDDAVRALAKAYGEQPIRIIQLMSENAIQRLRTGAVRAFADAFILRKDKKDG